MSDTELLLRAADPATNLGPVATDELRDAIVATRRTAGPRRAAAVTLGLTSIAIVGALALLTTQAPPIAVGSGETALHSDTGPHLIVAAPGWSMTRLDASYPPGGEVAFTDGVHTLDLAWRPAAEHQSWLDDRRASTQPEAEVTIGGTRAVVLAYGPTDRTALWNDGEYSLELRGNLPDHDAFAAVAASLQTATAGQWAAALPASTVTVAERSAAIDAMLADLPQPPGLDLGALSSLSVSSDRYQLGAAVSGAVACGWMAEWAAAVDAGDTAGAAAAAAALASAREWPILLEMDAEGDYPEVVWAAADAVNGQPSTATIGGDVGGRDITASYRAALGC